MRTGEAQPTPPIKEAFACSSRFVCPTPPNFMRSHDVTGVAATMFDLLDTT